MKEMSNKAAIKKQTGKRRQKKQSIFASGPPDQKERTGEPEMPASASGIRVSQSPRPKAAIISRADWLKTMRRAERKQTERNKDLSNASFFLGANSQLNELFTRAKTGNVDAARMLLGCLIYNVSELEKFCSSKTRIAKQMVVIGEPWPLLHSSLKPNKDGALTIPSDHFLRKIGVVRGKRRYDTESVGTATAFNLYKQMEFYRHTGAMTYWYKDEKDFKKVYDRIRKLKPLSPSNYLVWWKAAKPLFIKQWGDEFQDHSDFAGWNAAAYRKLMRDSHRSVTPRSAKRSNIRNAIKQGFMSLANSLRERVLD